jgi:hypothetical protein
VNVVLDALLCEVPDFRQGFRWSYFLRLENKLDWPSLIYDLVGSPLFVRRIYPYGEEAKLEDGLDTFRGFQGFLKELRGSNDMAEID